MRPDTACLLCYQTANAQHCTQGPPLPPFRYWAWSRGAYMGMLPACDLSSQLKLSSERLSLAPPGYQLPMQPSRQRYCGTMCPANSCWRMAVF